MSREFTRTVTTLVLVLPGVDAFHPGAIGHEIAELAQDAEVLDPWKDSPEHIQQAVDRAREFLRERTPAAEAGRTG